jgi:alkylation response protein AidB-like acyl-CoA dehydrogenase
MNFEATAEQEAMRESVRRLVGRTIGPLLQAQDRDRTLGKPVYREIFGKLSELGVTAARLPRDLGGPGIKMLEYGMVVELLPAPIAVSLLAHEVTLARLGAEGDEEQRRRLLPDLISGCKIACTGSTEPDAGSDPRGIKTRLAARGGRLMLKGRKMWITNVSACDVMLVTCLDHRDGTGGDKVIKVVLERDQSPFEAREIATIGLRQGMLGECVFEDCEVPPENVISGPRGGTEVLKDSWTVNRPLFGLIAVGLAQRAYDIALEYAGARNQFGKPIAGHQLVQKNLSDIVTAITASRLLCLEALWRVDRGLPADGASAMAKRFAQNACSEAVFQSMNLLGAMGLSVEARLEEIYRDIRMIAVPDGTNEILALIHGRELTGIGAFRDIETRGD